MTTLPKKRSTFDFVHENFNSFFLELKVSSCTYFFVFRFLLLFFTVDKNVLEKKNIQSFFMRLSKLLWGDLGKNVFY